MKFKSLEGLTVVITGASSGFGQGIALACARGGAQVVLAARREDLLKHVAQTCAAIGVQALSVVTDVSKPEEVEKMAQAALNQFGRIDVWINDAGIGGIGPFDEIPFDEHVQLINTDLIGTMAGSYVALKQFRKQGQGTLINFASALGKIPAPYYASYVAAKYAIVGFDASLRQEMDVQKLTDIDVCTVLPMANDTPFFQHSANHTGKEAVPIPPLYEPEEIVAGVIELITHPKAELIQGVMGNMMAAAHQIMPGAVEKMMAEQTQKAQMEKANAAEKNSGALKEPQAAGSGTRGGWSGKE